MGTQLIVDALNQPPFNHDLTLVTFDEKSTFELLQILNQIFTELSPQHTVDLRDETPDATADRMVEFIRVLNFRSTWTLEDLRAGLLAEDKDIIYSIMEWALGNLNDLKKRAYLSKYLTNIEVPEEYFADEAVVELYQQYQETQELFKQAHKTVDKMRGQSVHPSELKKEIAQMEMEKEQLNSKISKLKSKLTKLENFEELFSAVSKYRKEQEEEVRLQERKIEQEQQLAMSEQRLQQMRKKLKDTQSVSRDEDASALLQRLEEDVQITRALCEDKLPADINAKQTRLHHVQLVLDSPAVDESKLSNLNSEIKSLQNEIAGLLDQQAKREDPGGDEKLAMFRQQASVVAKRKQDLLDKLQMLNEERKELENELNEKQSHNKSGVKMLNKEEFQQFAESLRGKQNICKQKRAKLSEVKAELSILSRTEAILKSRCSHAHQMLLTTEKAKGVTGFTETQQALEGVSDATEKLNEFKGQSLEEISRLATEIIAQVKEKKNKLAPQIKELRAVRAANLELETTWQEKKQVYENMAVGLDAERSKLETQITQYMEEIHRDEFKYHHANCMSMVLEAQKQRVDSEGRVNISDGMSEYHSLKDFYQNKIQQQENRFKNLREEQKMARENHDGSLQQMEMFKDLKKLMTIKLQSAKAQAFDIRGPPMGANAAPNGADMFVME